jgi:hypothetical protein
MKLYRKSRKGKYGLVGDCEIIQKTEHNLILQMPNYALSVGYKDLQQKDYVLKNNDGSIYSVKALPTKKQVEAAIADKIRISEELTKEAERFKKLSDKSIKGWETRRRINQSKEQDMAQEELATPKPDEGLKCTMQAKEQEMVQIKETEDKHVSKTGVNKARIAEIVEDKSLTAKDIYNKIMTEFCITRTQARDQIAMCRKKQREAVKNQMSCEPVEIRNDTPESKNDTPEIKNDTPESKNDKPESKNDTPEINKEEGISTEYGNLSLLEDETSKEIDYNEKGTVVDEVNHPEHYKAGGIECIDYLQAKLTEEQFEGFCVGNALKYISRYRHKNGKEDLEKSRWYLNRILNHNEPA